MSGIPSWVDIGVRCVCIKTTWFTPPMPGQRHPVVGETLTISDIAEHPKVPGVVGIAFSELHPDDHYGVRNFAPLGNDETEAQAFRKAGRKPKAPRHVSEPA